MVSQYASDLYPEFLDNYSYLKRKPNDASIIERAAYDRLNLIY